MTTLRKALIPALSQIDSILGPSGLDLRPTTVSIITRITNAQHIGAGLNTDTVLVLPNWIKVRHITQREIAASGGRYEEGSVKVGPIRPQFNDPFLGSGGYTQAQLDPKQTFDPAMRTQYAFAVIYRLAQEDPTGDGIAGDYRLVELKRDRALRYDLVLNRVRATP